MHFTRFHALLLVGGVLLLLGPTTALTQPGQRGRGGPQGGGGPGGGGPGGGQFDPAAMATRMFDRVANGKDVITVADLENSLGKRDPSAHEKIQSFMQSQNITNGQLTRPQFATYMEQQMGQGQGGGGGRGQGGPGGPGGGPGGMRGSQGNPQDDDKNAEEYFRRQDKSGEGKLKYEDIQSPTLKDEFAKWDKNQNGVIELDEYKEYYKARMAAIRAENGGQSSGEGGAPWDQPASPANEGDKRPTVYHAGNLPKELPAWFVQLDKDKDGQVGLYEWKDAGKPIAEFLEMDVNGDGFLTVEEVLRYQRVMAKAKGGTSGTVVAAATGMPALAPAMPAMSGMPPGAPFSGGRPGGGNWGGGRPDKGNGGSDNGGGKDRRRPGQ